MTSSSTVTYLTPNQRSQLEATANWNKQRSIEAQKIGDLHEADRLWSNYIQLKKQLKEIR